MSTYLQQPTIAVIDLAYIKQPKAIFQRLTILTIFTLIILYARLYVQNFESPKFRPEDNPIAFAEHRITRIFSQNYLYVLNCFLLISPVWQSVDWSFSSIQLIDSWKDIRIFSIVIFYIILSALIFKGLTNR